jgi:hypothetical protein
MSEDRLSLKRLATITALVILAQIGLGTLLRHPGEGISFPLAMLHIAGAIIVFGVVFVLIRNAFRHHGDDGKLRSGMMALMFILTIQIVLGLTAYFVLLNQAGMVIPSNLQVIVNTLHVVVGAALWGTAVAIAVWSHAMPAEKEEHAIAA